MAELNPAALDAFRSLALGFALAGFLASGFELATARRASFRLLETGDGAAIASVPIVVLGAPFILLRDAVTRRPHQRARFAPAMLATIVACLWSLICGQAALDLIALLV